MSAARPTGVSPTESSSEAGGVRAGTSGTPARARARLVAERDGGRWLAPDVGAGGAAGGGVV